MTKSDKIAKLQPREVCVSDLVRYFDGDGVLFEDRGFSNGARYWFAADLMEMLGYESMAAFEASINRAIGTCTTLGIPVLENFQQCNREKDAQQISDYKLSRFACYLVAMNGDVRKPQVAKAQAYFANLAEAARQLMQSEQAVERVQIRDEISGRERSLSSAAKKAGVTQYGYFANAGYRGMYNVDLSTLKRMKGLSDASRTLLDFMGKRELAGNLFRLTETEARLKSDNVQGQQPAENVAFKVGRQVREMMVNNTGTRPELLELSGDIKEVRKGLKHTEKQLKRLDKTKK